MLAYCAIRKGPLYRTEAFHAGLKACGFEVRWGYPTGKCDLLVTWNRYGQSHAAACAAEKKGVPVIVAENGYVGVGGTSPKFDAMGDATPEHRFALARGGHNGQGRWPEGGPERWEALGIELKTRREGGDYVLVCPNRSFGVPGHIMPMDWPLRVVERLRGQTKMPVKANSHPGNDRPKVPLEVYLERAAVVVIWYSSAGVHALIQGIPVICEAPAWICKGASLGSLNDLPGALDGWEERRRHALERLAWAQWSMREIETGEPFKRLLEL